MIQRILTHDRRFQAAEHADTRQYLLVAAAFLSGTAAAAIVLIASWTMGAADAASDRHAMAQALRDAGYLACKADLFGDAR